MSKTEEAPVMITVPVRKSKNGDYFATLCHPDQPVMLRVHGPTPEACAQNAYALQCTIASGAISMTDYAHLDEELLEVLDPADAAELAKEIQEDFAGYLKEKADKETNVKHH